MGKQIAILAFDSLDSALVHRWSSAGLLPNFARLQDVAARAEVANPLGFEAGSVWPTLTTGQPVGVHGQYDGPYRFDTDAYEVRLMGRGERVVAPFWNHASAAGRRVAVVDVPYVLLDDVNGVHVVDWLTHVRTNPPGIASSPPAVAPGIVADYGANPFTGANRCPTNDAPVDSAEAVGTLRDLLLRRMAWKERYLSDLLRAERWDLFFGVFHEAHDIGHMCWHLHDPDHERHDAVLAAALGDPVRDIYIALDAVLGRLLDVLGDDPTVFVYTSHGMGRERTASRLLDDILARLDAAYRGTATDGAAPSGRDRGWADWAGAAYRGLIPDRVRHRLFESGLTRGAYRRARHSARTGALRRRLFFEQTANHATGGIRFNLKGREAAGMVEPGPALASLRRRLAADLAAIVNDETGEPLVSDILWTRDHHDGPMATALPDMLLEWNKSAPIRRVSSPLIGTLTDSYERKRSGDHVSKRGTVWIKGADAGNRRDLGLVPVTAFAPTVATLLGYDASRYPEPPMALTPATVAA